MWKVALNIRLMVICQLPSRHFWDRRGWKSGLSIVMWDCGRWKSGPCLLGWLGQCHCNNTCSENIWNQVIGTRKERNCYRERSQHQDYLDQCPMPINLTSNPTECRVLIECPNSKYLSIPHWKSLPNSHGPSSQYISIKRSAMIGIDLFRALVKGVLITFIVGLRSCGSLIGSMSLEQSLLSE